MADNDRSDESIHANLLARRMEKTSDALRRLADHVDQVRSRVLNEDKPNYVFLAGDVHHEIAWGLANMHLDQMFGDATDATLARDRAPKLES